ncbi:MAG: oligosaccharide flippase family protein [Bdellovibrionales bacterium]|nr:oligosaccharide flippase family protein [Bdellovibrionales bacterium]
MKRTYQSTTIITLFVSLGGMITGVLINRTLGPENRGLLTSLTFWQPLIAIFVTFGVHESLSYFIGRYPHSSRIQKLISSQFYFSSFFSLIGMALGVPFIHFFVANKAGEMGSLAYIYLLFIPLYVFSTNFQGIFLGQQNYRVFNFFRVLQMGSYLIGILFLFFTNNDEIFNYVVLFLISQLIALLAIINPIANNGILKYENKIGKLLLNKGLSFYLPFILGIYSTQWDMLFVVNHFNFTEIGLYQAAYTIANSSALIIAVTFQFLVFPMATRLQQIKDRSLFIVENYFLSLVGLLLLAALISLTAQWIIPLLFGSKFDEAIPILKILSWGYALINAKSIASKSIKALSEGRLSFEIEVIYVIVFALGAISLLYIKNFNITNLCLLILISSLFANIYFTLQFKKKYKLKWREIFNFPKALQRLIKSLS